MLSKSSWRKNLQEFELLDRKVNVIRLGSGGIKHEQKKALLAVGLKFEGRHFLTEARLTRGRGVCDLVDLDEGLVYEVVDSEGEASLDKKRAKYPFQVVVVKV